MLVLIHLIQQQGFAIGNGITNTAIQYQSYPDFALDQGIITKASYDEINKIIPHCERDAKICRTFSPKLLFLLH